ncbi:MAG: Hsp20 family protein [Candidatus Phytoplasma stylosanthis]|uniref:Hsp20 family protein n=1 Tax=Candidatus Phytoplasma stylosanthis TaxID=2798314 RepID=UPI00293B2537|nr:Hsp20 family protein [Candidatus Phytoplasma stylosanthis]MDV3168029.1 Hsp20 family protein [Candidatus Phytoplasma stylosanthis]MDV3170793.1 Hsp20 family protein [Candidatus Phytoplasma stylosanthis]MDV3173644.1 Hsp20 family protein [Candidatus Phytoplasma stylosanthis]MDV3174193.1 Hsp20 family protein [Candidatus Phytoplasma stylosanthis]MDV3202516.1 Hsp20 family protein [Candidatus Phytoplasma stylosanthis]
MSVISLINKNPDLLENLFENLRSTSFSNDDYFVMKTDIKEYKDHYVLISEVPGFKKEEIKVFLENGYLVLEAHPHEKEEEKENEFNYLRKERIKGVIRRSFNLGENFNMQDIQGSIENGLLIIKINKKQEEVKQKEYLELK